MKKWEIKEQNTEKIEEISNKYSLSKIVAEILVKRNILDEEKIQTFLNPTRNDFHDPMLINDMEKAVDRIIQAIDKKENVTIYGDYDVDGITSTSILKMFLEERGLNCNVYIPNRLEEGYGLNIKAIDKIKNNGTTLIITVDCGITANKEIEYANECGIETIVTDHHEPTEILPNAYAVIDNKRKDSKYPFRELAGVGVVFKVIQAICIKLNLSAENYLKYLDIVCVGTISDIVPLVDENRIITKLGMMLVKQTRNFGLRAIINKSGYKKIDSTAISFGVAPRINACGRMGLANIGLNLFLSKDIKEIDELSDLLNTHNKARQDEEKKIFDEAISKIEKEGMENRRTIVVANEGWHHGVIGIVSSKITEKYFKPSILLCLDEDIGKGSGRSIAGFNIHEALSRCTQSVESFGGHSMAIGIAIKKERIEELAEAFENQAKISQTEKIHQVIQIDAEQKISDLTIETVNELEKLEPYGEANPMPNFMIKNVKIDGIRQLSDGKHIKLILRDGTNALEAIGFNMGNIFSTYILGDIVDVVGTITINEYNNKTSIQLLLKDIKKSF